MTKNDIEVFDKLSGQLDSLYSEINTLVKKTPNDAVNSFKLKFINEILKDANSLLGERFKPFKDFSCFEDDNLPTNSDVAMIVGQYINCMEELRANNISYDMGRWCWIIDGERSKITTVQPLKLRIK